MLYNYIRMISGKKNYLKDEYIVTLKKPIYHPYKVRLLMSIFLGGPYLQERIFHLDSFPGTAASSPSESGGLLNVFYWKCYFYFFLLPLLICATWNLFPFPLPRKAKINLLFIVY